MLGLSEEKMKQEKICKNCKYFGDNNGGFCFFPEERLSVHEVDWCGEWRERK